MRTSMPLSSGEQRASEARRRQAPRRRRPGAPRRQRPTRRGEATGCVAGSQRGASDSDAESASTTNSDDPQRTARSRRASQRRLRGAATYAAVRRRSSCTLPPRTTRSRRLNCCTWKPRPGELSAPPVAACCRRPSCRRTRVAPEPLHGRAQAALRSVRDAPRLPGAPARRVCRRQRRRRRRLHPVIASTQLARAVAYALASAALIDVACDLRWGTRDDDRGRRRRRGSRPPRGRMLPSRALALVVISQSQSPRADTYSRLAKPRPRTASGGGAEARGRSLR